jgi:hypothetical protein
MKEKIEQLQEKQERLIELVKQYEKAKANEHKKYHLFEDKEVNRKENHTDTYMCDCGRKSVRWFIEPDYQYYLVNRESNEIVCYGHKQRVKAYLRIRNISLDDVWNDVDNFGSL